MNPQGDSSGTSPHLSIELLEKLLPSFLLAAENRQRFRKELPLFPIPTVPLHQTLNVGFGSNISLSSSHAGTSQNPSSYVDLSLRLGPPNQDAIRSTAMSSSNIFAPRHAVGVQGMHGSTSKSVHLQTKRGFPGHAFGDLHLGNMGQLALLAKRRATESLISASNHVNPSPPLSQMQQLFGQTTPSKPIQVGQGGLKDKGKAIESSSSSSHYRQMGVPAQAYIQERLLYRPIGSSPSPHNLTRGPLPVAAMMPNLCPISFEQRLDNENIKNAQTDKLDYAELQADVVLNDTEEEEEEEIPDQEDQGGDVLLAQDGQMMEDPVDDEGKYIIEPIGKDWSPAQRAVDGINYVIQSQFRGVFHSYGMIPSADREEWFRIFKEKCTWEARHEQHIRKKFDSHCSKHLAEILTQAKKFGPDPYPDEFFLATNKYKSTGHGVDTGAQKTHEGYQLRLLQQKSQVGEASTSLAQDTWSEVAKGKSSGHVQPKATSLTQESGSPPSSSEASEGIDKAQQ
ncbi:hypothetical protein VNO80_21507 [Phaseolus coccineus]|uniref:Uncharacterized protein n=1 Tax=Phaseolus coccineus TaxID=3886 RepID=A0AAN9QXS7_PHACN